MNENKKVDILFEKKNKFTYHSSSINAVNKILYGSSFRNNNVIFYGSSIYKLTSLLAGDLDCMEYIQEDNPKKIVVRLSQMITDIIDENKKNIDEDLDGYEQNLVIIGDIKCGLDERFTLDVGHIHDMKIIGFNKKRLIKDIDKLKNIISLEEYETITSLINFIDKDLDIPNSELELIAMSNPEKYKPILTMWSYIYNFFYNKSIIRWKPKDIINKYVMWNNKKFYLEDTIKNGMCKFDLIYYDIGKYMEVSNTMMFKINGKLNMSDDVNKLIDDLKFVTWLKFYDRGAYNLNFLKGFKLMYSICKVTNNSKYMLLLNKPLTGDFGRVGKIISELKTCRDAIKMYKNSSSFAFTGLIYDIIMSIPSVLDSTTLFKNYDRNLYTDIDNLYKTIYNSKEEISDDIYIDVLNVLIHNLQDNLNEEIAIYAVDNGLYPLNKIFLP